MQMTDVTRDHPARPPRDPPRRHLSDDRLTLGGDLITDFHHFTREEACVERPSFSLGVVYTLSLVLPSTRVYRLCLSIFGLEALTTDKVGDRIDDVQHIASKELVRTRSPRPTLHLVPVTLRIDDHQLTLAPRTRQRQLASEEVRSGTVWLDAARRRLRRRSASPQPGQEDILLYLQS